MKNDEKNRQFMAETDKNGRINIGFIASLAAPLVFNGLRWAADKINLRPLRGFLQNCAIKRVEEITGLLIDNNPANNQQLAEYWKREKFAIAKELIQASNEIIAELEAEGENDKTAELKKLKG